MDDNNTMNEKESASSVLPEVGAYMLKGAAIGIADAVPGVSGGTLAVILGIYDKLLESITLNIKTLKKNIRFIIPVCVGIAAGLLIASKVLTWLLENHNVPTQFFFLGVIIGSLPLMYRECVKERKLKIYDAVPFLAAAAGMIAFGLFAANSSNSSYSISPVIIILMTAAAAAAMIIPGISGALVLKALGGYDLAIRSVSSLDIVTLLFYAIGAAIGLLGAAKVISVLLKKHHVGTYCALIGLVAGSIPAIFPEGFAFNADGIIGIVMLMVGIAVPTVTAIPGKMNTNAEKDAKI